MTEYDPGAGIVQGPFNGCGCQSHHHHGPHGAAGCPVCAPMQGDFDVANLRYAAELRLRGQLVPNDLESSQYLSSVDD